MKRSDIKLVAVAATVLTLSACASAPKPTSEVVLSDAAMQAAEAAGARELAPIELRQAREKQQLAQKAMKQEEYRKARMLSQQALVDAELAAAKAEAEKARMALREVDEGMQLMRTEVDRAKSE